MKKLITICLAMTLAFAGKTIAQIIHPQIGSLKGINYQAVAIDENGKEIVGMDINGKPVYNKTIGLRFTITKGNIDSLVEYQETQTALTDAYGLFSLVIGQGTQTGAGLDTSLMDIPWIDADQFLKVEISTKNDGNYRVVSNQQFMTVPYAFYADDIADDAITTWKILDEEIKNIDIDTGAVETSEILNLTILNEDIADSSIDSRTILDETILANDIATGAVTTSEILDLTILNEDISDGAVDSRTILDETILSTDIATGAVTTSEILDATILNEDIANGTIDLTTKVTGILPVPNGGTGVASSTDGGILLGGGSNPIKALPQATDGQIPVGVTGTDPRLKVLSAGVGIGITFTTDSVIISNGVQGINTFSVTFDFGTVNSMKTVLSSAIGVAGVNLGDIVLVSINTNLQGCMVTAYVFSNNNIKVAIFNGTPANVSIGAVTIRGIIVK